MIQLYIKTPCQFSVRVISVLKELKIPFEEKNVLNDAYRDELISLGGKKQTPCIVDGDTVMYESKSIIEYIEQKYGTDDKKDKTPRIHSARGSEGCKL